MLLRVYSSTYHERANFILSKIDINQTPSFTGPLLARVINQRYNEKSVGDTSDLLLSFHAMDLNQIVVSRTGFKSKEILTIDAPALLANFSIFSY